MVRGREKVGMLKLGLAAVALTGLTGCNALWERGLDMSGLKREYVVHHKGLPSQNGNPNTAPVTPKTQPFVGIKAHRWPKDHNGDGGFNKNTEGLTLDGPVDPREGVAIEFFTGRGPEDIMVTLERNGVTEQRGSTRSDDFFGYKPGQLRRNSQYKINVNHGNQMYTHRFRTR